jgi:hypothetical protein
MSDAPKSLVRRLEVQLAEKTREELIEIIARGQHKAAQPVVRSVDEIELIEKIGKAYFGPDDMRGLTLPMMARNMESDALALGYPVREYLKRFTNAGHRRRQS